MSGHVRAARLPDASIRHLQVALNELLVPLGYRPVDEDGIAGPFTRQALAAARLAAGIEGSRTMPVVPGCDHVPRIDTRRVPARAPAARRWVMVDKTAQALVAGEAGRRIVMVLPVSTGTPEHETRLVDAIDAFRYEPAADNAGWRNSTTFPVAPSHPRGGNMYRPVYFSRGQAIHGTDELTAVPASHGCVLVTPAAQDLLVSWLGLDGIAEPLWDAPRIGLAVTVIGSFGDGEAGRAPAWAGPP